MIHMELPIDKLTRHFQNKINDYILPKCWNGRSYDYQGWADKLNELFGFDGNDRITSGDVQTFFNGNYTRKNALFVMLGLLRIHKVPYECIFPQWLQRVFSPMRATFRHTTA